MNIGILGSKDVKGLIMLRSSDFSPKIPKFLKSIGGSELTLAYIFSSLAKDKLSKKELERYEGYYKFCCKDWLKGKIKPFKSVLNKLMKKKFVVKRGKYYQLNISENEKPHIRYKFWKEVYRVNPGKGKTGKIPAKHIVLSAKERGKVVGYLEGIIVKSPTIYRAEVECIDVHPQYRRKGIGRGLLKDFEKRCIKEDCTHIGIEAETKAAIKFYEKCGYSRGWISPDGKIIMEKTFRK